MTKGGVTEVAKKAGRNRFVPDANATGAHTVFRKDPLTGKVTHYETFRPQTNSKNPSLWESVKRYDVLDSIKWRPVILVKFYKKNIRTSYT
jgi:hypothetical protein